ncbi:uncharacterized protein TRIADDRAFT_51014 [Trichoplax adhaerens]|uniref:Importin N-terminal domain-containing protein n=1 Tax=Trichoplax adhaerens TaxID=10228 RepID=B3SAB4_TRIAD|nr:hypothetical protein TRIADDRAFT_51014 [Trichoplax adhaerens]EDV20281.1 hypothetical protein TRIADDRAFT_51014 [Trichoplax adhaerens]|eukprot:XP_002117231.1 hypothetical protein TRIADDRAFT_51014 [Trichoplax adhaerens]
MAIILPNEDEAKRLLDFNQKFPVDILDRTLASVNMCIGELPQRQYLQKVLDELKQHPHSWTVVEAILELSTYDHSKYFALQILEYVIQTRWKVLPPQQRQGIKDFTVGQIIKISSDTELAEKQKTFLNKMNIILVQILKKEWPKNWPTFISDICGSCRTNQSLCQNNLVILKLLSEDVFEFSLGQMTQGKIKHLKDSMCNEFSEVYALCQHIMETSQNPQLICTTLNTLLRFLSWIPLGYIFETNLINTMIYKFLNVPLFRNATLKCLTEISGIKASQYEGQFIELFTSTLANLKQILPLSINIKEAYGNGTNDEQYFIQNLSLFLHTFLSEHGDVLEAKALHYLVLISEVEETEIFKICLEYWNTLAADLYRESPLATASPILGLPTHQTPRRQLYQSVLSKVRYIMISRMAKPEEVLVVENEHGEVVREFMKDTDAINMYKSMRETLVYLTHLDYTDIERIMTEKLQNQVNGTEWSWKNLNTLCWAIGSISGAMHEEGEKRFLVAVIKDLLGLCEVKRGKDNKAIIASNIMYIVGQYPRFLRAHWKFLKTVVNKLFEFMHETHDGVQDMACDTFIKIAQKCRPHFIHVQSAEVMPFIETILNDLSSIICDLQPQQVQTFYEAVGYMISAQPDKVVMERLIEKLMSLPNSSWDTILNEASKNPDILKDPENLKTIYSILKTNGRACKSIGHDFIVQLRRNYLEMLNLYSTLGESILSCVATRGEAAVKEPVIKTMRAIKKEILKLISKWIEQSHDPKTVCENFIPPLMNAVLGDYQRSIPAAREPEVLNSFAIIINRLENHIMGHIPVIFTASFQCTLNMINKDFEEYPEHRVNFYLLLQAITKHTFEAFFHIPPDEFSLVINSIIWGMKHTMRNVADTALDMLQTFLENVQLQAADAAKQGFYQAFYVSLLQHVFSVLTDSSHVASLNKQAKILAYMFRIVENGKVKIPLYDPSNAPNPNMDNRTYLLEFIGGLLKQAYPHLLDSQIHIIVKGLFDLNEDTNAFREHLRDFLVQIKEYCGEDVSDLFLSEREAELAKADEEKRKRQMAVPGILNPHELPDKQDNGFQYSLQN